MQRIPQYMRKDVMRKIAELMRQGITDQEKIQEKLEEEFPVLKELDKQEE